MSRILTLVIISIALVSCKSKQPSILSTSSNPFQSSASIQPLSGVDGYSMNKDYGLEGEFPIKVGDKSPANQRRYIAALAGPNGEVLSFHRRGSCCPYDSPNGFGGSALVDVYEVTYEGLDEPILLYISFYDFEKLYVPKGLTKREL
ncbi:hypothetical protein J1N09_04740 [Aureitalea sp. L0-47]|uniref:hypothetical protein n=1 Tax=Aureitalea sp. L0-47 TaxID=2816962 RepID=UPI002237DA3B|nr:hypothetical protein [Aureitalea sp. L0-47]MCW5519132.1 hypothetical protein [Aureitalea sp. L0-47]